MFHSRGCGKSRRGCKEDLLSECRAHRVHDPLTWDCESRARAHWTKEVLTLQDCSCRPSRCKRGGVLAGVGLTATQPRVTAVQPPNLDQLPAPLPTPSLAHPSLQRGHATAAHQPLRPTFEV